MRSDREELPEGYTKEDADKAEIAEAKILAASKSRNVRTATTATNAIAAAAPTDCMTYFPQWMYQVCGAIRVKYDSLGGPVSFLLLPTSNELVNPDGFGRRNTFQNGPIYWSAASGAHPVVNHFMMKWGEHGWEAGYLGYPTTDEIVLTNGRRQEFQGAAIYWSPVSLGAIGGAIRDKWNTVGAETGPLGYPTSDEIAVTKNNGRYNNFTNGTVTWSGPTGARLLYGAIRDRWFQLGREDGALGYPLADEQSTSNGVAHHADFENGTSIWWTALTGAHDMPTDILAPWNSHGAQTGNLGYPVANPTTVTTDPQVTLHQRFQGGVINLLGTTRALVGMYDPTPDPVPEPENLIAPSPQERSGPGPMAIPPGATWPAPDVAPNYDTSDIVGSATNANWPQYGDMPIRQGYWSTAWADGWGQDKAEHKHQLKYVESIEFVLESKYYGARSDSSDPGTDFWAYATDSTCQLTWSGKECQEVQRRTVHAIYDYTSWPNYKLSPGGDPIGVVSAYCGGGNTPLSGGPICDSWVDMALMNPEN